jgi:hypothetical protein
MKAGSHASSSALEALLFGPLTRGTVLSPHHLQFGDYIVSLTTPGAARMPNGIECASRADPNDRIAIGAGTVVVGRDALEAGPAWDPIPTFARLEIWPAGPEPVIAASACKGPGLTPAGDDLLAGYVAGLVLLHAQRVRAVRLAERAASRTTALSATLLRHAARGEVPEPVHVLLATGDVRPLLAFGHSSGSWWLRGLVSAGYPLEDELALVRPPTSAAGVQT